MEMYEFRQYIYPLMRKRGNKQITDSITTIYCDVKSSQLAKLWGDAHVFKSCVHHQTNGPEDS
jgi:hypothetical protein